MFCVAVRLLRQVSTAVGRSNKTIRGKRGDSCVFYDSVLYDRKSGLGVEEGKKKKEGFS